MYLSKLELHGFKSFADRTIVDFSSGVTAVVGPNGCGKSNIVDAVRWVIGEQRARILRSDKMDDVIFNGTSSRRSLGMSEVLLTIENTRGVLPIEYSEVTIGRRLFRSGESEYLLNGVQCRLKDITDLFMDTGMGAGAYSVIELKMIEDILSDSAGDRRHMFEEAAGISKYKTRRGQTLRKLASTQADLNRVRDLVDELEKRVRSLERQAKKASRFKKLDDRLTYLVLALGLSEYRDLSEESVALNKTITALADEVSVLTAKLAGVEATHEALRKDHVDKEQAVSNAQIRLAQHLDMLRQAESDLRLNHERSKSIERDRQRAELDQKDADERISKLRDTLESVLEAHALAIPAADESASRLEVAREEKSAAEKNLADLRSDLQRASSEERRLQFELSERQRQVDRLTNRSELCDQELKKNDLDVKGAESSLLQVISRREDIESALVVARTKHAHNQEQLDAARDLHLSKTQALTTAEKALHERERRSAGVRAELGILDSLLSSYDELSESVQYLASSSDWTSDTLRTVSDLFACDESHRIALDAALGDFASCIVVKSEQEAAKAIHHLKADEKGRATFIVIDRLDDRFQNGARNDKAPSGAVPLSALIRIAESGFSALPEYLLHDCFLVDDLDAIVREEPSSGRFFTQEGEWFDAAGFRHGGSPATGTSAAAGRLGRREQFDRLQAEITELETESMAMVNLVMTIEGERAAIPLGPLEADLAASGKSIADLESLSGQIEFESSSLLARKKDLTQRRIELDLLRTQLQEEIRSLRSGHDALDSALSYSRAKRTESESRLQELEEINRGAFSRFNEMNILAVQNANNLEHLTRERSRIQTELQRLDADTIRRSEQSAILATQLAETSQNSTQIELELGQLRISRNDLDAVASASKDVLAEVKVALSNVEAELREIRRQREEAMKGESKHSVRKAEIETRLTDIIHGMLEDYELDITTHSMEIEEGFSIEPARAEIRDLRTSIRNLGPVNALALESFDDEKSRLDFLQEQLADLEQAENTLMTTIGEINETASKRFDETFSAIRDNFQRLFIELFGEDAAADVILESPDDPLESPIEVMARPKGKKLSVLAQLSGGEKTLTAIALLFAIYLVKPSPFCILDEVDAPLDDANVDRFMHMIRTFSNSTQFILVTHNKRTMEAADCMYGITMAEQGVSKLVSVKFDAELELAS